MKMRIPVPFQWKTYSASYRWGFSEALKSKRERKPGQIGTLMAIEAYRAGYAAGTTQREKQNHISTRVTEEFV
jgi:hypothetical protein